MSLLALANRWQALQPLPADYVRRFWQRLVLIAWSLALGIEAAVRLIELESDG